MSLGDLILYAVVLLIVGIACGFINTLASSGSAISLPMLMMLGLPALAANATNRLPVLFGSLMALRTFQTQGKVDWSAAWRIVLPATVGSAVGVYLAERIPNRYLGLIITAAVLIALLLLFTKSTARQCLEGVSAGHNYVRTHRAVYGGRKYPLD
jgi:uncharacterized protein